MKKQVMVWSDANNEFINRIHYYPELLDEQDQNGMLLNLPKEPAAKDGFSNVLKLVKGALVWEQVEIPPAPKTDLELLQEENEKLKQQLADLQATS